MEKTNVCILGRNGDAYMVLHQFSQETSGAYRFVLKKQFAGIVRELFPWAEVLEVDNDYWFDKARWWLSVNYPADKVISPMQADAGRDLMRNSFCYQTYQEWMVKGGSHTDTVTWNGDKPKKVRVYLGGVSCELPNPNAMLSMIAYTCDNLGLPFEVVEEQPNWTALLEKCNEPGYLWIVNDTSWGHLIHRNPYIIIVRDIVWLWPRARKNCVGRFTQSMLMSMHASIYLTQAMLRCKAIRQHGNMPARLFHLTSDYRAKDALTAARNAMASASWGRAAMEDPNFEQILAEDEMRVDELLRGGLEFLQTDEDLLVITNRDISLTPETPAILRAYMDFMNIDACYVNRIDVSDTKQYTTMQLDGKTAYVGTDLFCFRKNWAHFDKLLSVPLWIGAGGWDWYWRGVIGNRCPWNVAYHFTHETNWEGSEKTKENMRAIQEVCPQGDTTKLPLW